MKHGADTLESAFAFRPNVEGRKDRLPLLGCTEGPQVSQQAATVSTMRNHVHGLVQCMKFTVHARSHGSQAPAKL